MNKCLIVVDMVNGFVREGVLHDTNIARIIPGQIELIKETLDEGNMVIFVKDTHFKNAAEFERFGNTEHCVRGTSECELVDELKEYEDRPETISVEKNSTNFMEAPKFRMIMDSNQAINNFEIVGCCTDICVFNGAMGLANYLDEHNRKHNIVVYEDLVATYSEDERQDYVKASKLLMEQQGIKVLKRVMK